MGFSKYASKEVMLIVFIIPILFFGCDRNSGFMEPPLLPTARLIIPDFFTTRDGQVEVKSFFENADLVRTDIADYGFLWSDQPFEDFSGASKISLGSDFNSRGWFEAELNSLTKQFYYCRSYVSYSNNESYFSEQSVINTRPGQWVEKSSFPGGAKIGATSFVIKNTAYIVGGQSAELWSYDPVVDKWTQMADCPEPLDSPVSFVLHGKAYVGTDVFGIHSDRLADFWRYDPVTDEWTVIASPSAYKGGLVSNPFAFSMGGFGYMECNYNHLIQYDPSTDKWSNANPNTVFEFDRKNAIVVSSSDSVIVVGGRNVLGDYLEDVQIFTAGSGGWEIKNTFPQDNLFSEEGGRTSGLGFYLAGKFYAGMGEAENRQSFSEMYVYDPLEDQWVVNSPIPAHDFGNFGIQGGVGFSVGEKGYIGLGRRNWTASVNEFSEVNLRIWEFIPD